MGSRTLCAIGLCGLLLFVIVAAVQSDTGATRDPSATKSGPRSVSEETPDKGALKQEFLAANPGVPLTERAGRITRVYGRSFSQAASAQQSAEAFRVNHAEMFGVPPRELIPVGPFPDGRHVQPIMYQRDTGTYRFTGYFYTQERSEVPVFRSGLKLVCALNVSRLLR